MLPGGKACEQDIFAVYLLALSSELSSRYSRVAPYTMEQVDQPTSSSSSMDLSIQLQHAYAYAMPMQTMTLLFQGSVLLREQRVALAENAELLQARSEAVARRVRDAVQACAPYTGQLHGSWLLQQVEMASKALEPVPIAASAESTPMVVIPAR